jgi:hypothetical protein
MVSALKRPVILFALAAAVALAGGCSGAGGSALTGELAAAPAPIQLGGGRELEPSAGSPFTLPSLADLEEAAAARQASEVLTLEPLILRGDEYAMADADATVNADWNAAELPAGSREATWVVYRFGALAPDAKLGYLEALIGEALPQVLYFALADYATGNWRWFSLDVPDLGTLEASFSRPLEDAGDYVSDTGGLYLAVATWDTASCQVRRVTLNLGVRQVYVQGLKASDGASASEITIGWQPLAGCTGYELYYRLAEFPGPLVLLSEISGADASEFVHSTANPPEHAAQADTQYIYFIMAVFADGYRSQLSGWDTGYCGTLP